MSLLFCRDTLVQSDYDSVAKQILAINFELQTTKGIKPNMTKIYLLS